MTPENVIREARLLKLIADIDKLLANQPSHSVNSQAVEDLHAHMADHANALIALRREMYGTALPGEDTPDGDPRAR